MIKKIGSFAIIMLVIGIVALPVYAQAGPAPTTSAAPYFPHHFLAIAMAIAAAGCGYAQSNAVRAGCDGVSRNPGSADSARFFVILGLAFIEFLALLTFVVVLFLLP